MAQVACRFGLAIAVATIAIPVSAHDGGATAVRNNEQAVPFSSISPDVVVPPGESDPSAQDPGDRGADSDRGAQNDPSDNGAPDDGAPIDATGGNDHAIPA